MKCPYCGNEMRQGYIRGNGVWLFFSNEHRPIQFINRKQGDIILNKPFWDYDRLTAFCCEGCKNVIIDYSAAEG